jgi:hypothetical protein
MKMFKKDRKRFPRFDEQLEEIGNELRGRRSSGEVAPAWQLEVLDYLFRVSQLDPATFHETWIQPLLAAGLSLDAAITLIADSHFRLN